MQKHLLGALQRIPEMAMHLSWTRLIVWLTRGQTSMVHATSLYSRISTYARGFYPARKFVTHPYHTLAFIGSSQEVDSPRWSGRTTFWTPGPGLGSSAS